MLTPKQRPRLFALMGKAWSAHCETTGAARDNVVAFDAWRRDELLTATGHTSTKELNHTTDYDAAMLHFGIIANDEGVMAHFSGAAERRMMWLIRGILAALGKLEGRVLTWDYARGVAKQMDLPLRMSECPVEMLKSVFLALDTHRRRIEASRGDLEPRRGNEGLGSRRWKHDSHQHVGAA